MWFMQYESHSHTATVVPDYLYETFGFLVMFTDFPHIMVTAEFCLPIAQTRIHVIFLRFPKREAIKKEASDSVDLGILIV